MTRGQFLRPLRGERPPSDPDLLAGARLLERVGPSSRSEHRKRRVWNALSLGTAPRFGVRVRTLHLAFAGLLFAAASGATVSGYYATQSEPEPAVPVAPVVAVVPRAAPVPARPPAAERSVEVAARKPEHVPAPVRSKPEGAANGVRAQSEAEAQLLVEAMRARREGDSKRVSELVDEYRSKHPQGALQEEALILSIESAAARRAPNTAALAREYLKRFPKGRFVAQARRALAIEAR